MESVPKPKSAWGGVETNEFGTDEFMKWCSQAKAEPCIYLNMGTGTLDEAIEWLEYCNSTGDCSFAQLRRQNGHEKPYNVKYWELGNEVYGDWQAAQSSPAEYTAKAVQWAKGKTPSFISSF
ncbi:alpha-N-arabinofuranosidase C [Penicillium angulare]|uniref:Alpha-N-arabinofuranosidase C n=1 Tax=Penicillium angulare TaxID=116970 RepID=A0A9W9G7L2_9EURO|nr:alpha-N-arabinofuranosidase C [Penicillium angulare]